MLRFDDFNLEKCADGLLPVIVQDAATLKVLMLGYMNREAFDKTVAEGRVTFFSRTRSTLWTKGETRGNYLLVKDMYIDCDNDTLLITEGRYVWVSQPGKKLLYRLSHFPFIIK